MRTASADAVELAAEESVASSVPLAHAPSNKAEVSAKVVATFFFQSVPIISFPPIF
ncbi:hypothetical protein SDC9_112150 [bioreactor metagenome]|uniref:Uncharacterized protein n=1 Tax=bioreactor metagenome TaxID=1076179 RepID=A0A645BIP4_9ZZZZ